MDATPFVRPYVISWNLTYRCNLACEHCYLDAGPKPLVGRCGACEMNAQCGGCRARAYGMTGDLMAEDPLCTHTPGKFAGSPVLTLGGSMGAIKYVAESPPTIA